LWDLLKEQRVAVVLLAGGQGSRLGHRGPKGTVNIGLPSQKSLFQLQAERLISVSKRVGIQIPWYIMTSEINYHETKEFFKKNNYFGYDKNDIRFFKQKSLPTITEDGKIILKSKSEISFAPNGNGGVFESLYETGLIAEMKDNRVKWIFLNNIDNALVRVADPKFIGFADIKDSPVSSKSVRILHPHEKVGILCKAENTPSVLEYSEIPKNLSEAINDKGALFLESANIGMHLFKLDFIINSLDEKLPFHFAHKKISTIDKYGNKCEPEKPNGYKLEKFYFDVFHKADSMSVLQVSREEEFAPVKNKTGVDSLESARDMIISLQKLWLLQSNMYNNNVTEVSPLVSYEGEGLTFCHYQED
jgi:UDP-N-acetylglucosamine pyrophosphorylase